MLTKCKLLSKFPEIAQSPNVRRNFKRKIGRFPLVLLVLPRAKITPKGRLNNGCFLWSLVKYLWRAKRAAVYEGFWSKRRTRYSSTDLTVLCKWSPQKSAFYKHVAQHVIVNFSITLGIKRRWHHCCNECNLESSTLMSKAEKIAQDDGE